MQHHQASLVAIEISEVFGSKSITFLKNRSHKNLQHTREERDISFLPQVWQL